MNKTKKKSRSFSQAKIKAVCDELCDNIDLLCETFELNCKHTNKMITMACPIHGGDNESALNLYYVGDSYRGNWVCRTHHCERVFQPSIIGFLRGVLSVKNKNWNKDGDEMYSFDDTMTMALKILHKDIKDVKINNTNLEKKTFIKNIQSISPVISNNVDNLPTRAMVRKALDIPAKYYLDRGYSKNILDKYDVGLCNNPNKEMFDRVVVPIYDQQHTYMVGCSGRSIYEKCQQCSYYHNTNTNCISHEYGWKYSKWKHNKDFKSKDHLYNLWFSKDYILKTGIAVIVESPGNVWRLEEAGIKNSIAIFGTSLSDRQKMLLDCSGAMSLLILLDNDEAGQLGTKQIYDKCYRTYNIKTLSINTNDIADMDADTVKRTIIPEMEKIHV